MRVYCRSEIVNSFVAAVLCIHLLHCRLVVRGRGLGGAGDDVPRHHRCPSYLARFYWKYEAVSRANFDIPQDPGRELSKEQRIRQ